MTGHVPRGVARALRDARSRGSPRDLVRLGVVAVHDPGALSLQEGLGAGIAAYRALDERGDLPIRVHACIREEQLEAAAAAGLRSGDPLGPAGRPRPVSAG